MPVLIALPCAAAEEMTREEIAKRWRAQAGIQEAPTAPDPETQTRGLSIVPAGSAAESAAGAAAIGNPVADAPSVPADRSLAATPNEAASNEPERYDASITVDLRITFATNSAEIRPEAVPTLATLCAAMQEAPLDWRFNIVGHADASGSASRNKELSEARARAVAARLVRDCGIDEGRLAVFGLGEARLLPDVAPVSEANRRVEVSLSQR